MKKLGLRLIGLTALILVTLLVFFTDIVDVASFLPKIRFQRTTTRVSSTVTLQAVRDVYAFNTVEYVHRAVFPYDYLPEGINLNGILTKIRNGGVSVVEALEPDEYVYFRAYSLATDVGMDPGSDRDFLVVTVVVTAGFDLTNSPLTTRDAAEETDSESALGAFTVEAASTENGEIRRVLVPAPPAMITDIRVEDILVEDYPYPDVAIGADDWRRVADFVREQTINLPQMGELITIAQSNGEEFVRGLLLKAGYDEVVFVQNRPL